MRQQRIAARHTVPDRCGDDFYRNLPVLSEFNAIEHLAGFHPAPADWLVAITDVINSTDCVAGGRYKEVNIIGASCITAVLNQLVDVDIPFSFGGDGATLLVPGRLKPAVQSALVRVRALAQRDFNIELRIGFVPVKTVRNRGRDVLVARYKVSAGNSLAMFSGGGIELADKLIKADRQCRDYAIEPSTVSEAPDLNGLSCRWQPLESRKGRMACLLIQAQASDTEVRHRVLSHILRQLDRILDDDLSASSPVTDDTLRFFWPPGGLKIEALLTRGTQSYIRRYLYLLFESLIQYILERFRLKAGHYDAAIYKKELQANADYRRFDDTLRLVLDCTPSQISEITKMLSTQHRQKKIAYGMHLADQAQMTCLVFSLQHHEHIHFIDGGDGGFWAAAAGYKKQLSQLGEIN